MFKVLLSSCIVEANLPLLLFVSYTLTVVRSGVLISILSLLECTRKMKELQGPYLEFKPRKIEVRYLSKVVSWKRRDLQDFLDYEYSRNYVCLWPSQTFGFSCLNKWKTCRRRVPNTFSYTNLPTGTEKTDSINRGIVLMFQLDSSTLMTLKYQMVQRHSS